MLSDVANKVVAEQLVLANYRSKGRLWQSALSLCSEAVKEPAE